MNNKKSGCLPTILMAGALGVWYATHPAPMPRADINESYPLPEEIVVLKTDLPYENRTRDDGKLEKVVKTKNIDFSKDSFEIKTDRYRFVKDDDWLPSRAVGFVASLPQKLFFWDWSIGQGLDEKRTRAALAMIENDKEFHDITLRVNHNEAFYDWWRMMSEPKLRDRNPFLYRAIVGSISTIKDEIWAEFGRGDYYNTLTRTAVVYSNVESITAHELGHNRDFDRFKTDWLYSLGRTLPPVMCYQEWKASSNARDEILSKNDKWQFERYLIPAFATYILASISIIKRLKKKYWDEKEEPGRGTSSSRVRIPV